MYDPKKGKYTEDENNHIIHSINNGIANGKREREILREIANDLNRGYAGIMSHVRKLRQEYPERFISSDNYNTDQASRLNSWEPNEEEIVIDTVNRFLEEGKSLSAAIVELETLLSRTQGAIYQRIYTLRRKNPDRFKFLPQQRPRRRRKISEWQMTRPIIRNLEDSYPFSFDDRMGESHSLSTSQPGMGMSSSAPWNSSMHEAPTSEESMIIQAFEERYGRPNQEAKGQLIYLMRQFGCTRVSIALLTLADDKEFPNVIANFLSHRLQQSKFM